MGVHVQLGDRYRLVERLGSGGMSIVWRGYDEILRRQVAVKVLSPEYATNADLRAGLYREAKAAAGLSHPHIAGVYDYGESESDEGHPLPFVVMELVAGVSLARRLDDGGVLPWPEAAVVCAQVASALAEAHAHGVVHRDVKPSNVMLTSAGAKVVDFGISALVGETNWEPDGHLLATPAYVAPERLLDGREGTPADVYALGLLLYRMVAGTLPWQAATLAQTLTDHRYVEPAPLPQYLAIPAEARRLCDQCLAKDPDDRPSSHEVAAALAGMDGVTSPAGVATFGPGLGKPKTGGLLSSELTEPLRSDDLTKRLRTSTLHTGSARAPAHRGKRRAAAAVGLAAALLLAVGAAAWMPGPTGAVAVLAALTPSTPADQCRVRYQVERVWRDGFEATVKMTNSGGHDLRDATLRFAFPSDQTIRTSQSWAQVGREVSAPLGGAGHALPAGASVELRFTASYASENVLPTAFYVGAAACETTVAATAPTPVPTAQRTPSTKDKGKKKNADN